MYNDDTKTEEEKQLLKKKIFNQLPIQFQEFKHKHDLDKRYDKWVLSMNNASLSTLANYQELVAGFIALFHKQGGDWNRFYVEVESIAKLDKQERHQFLTDLAEVISE